MVSLRDIRPDDREMIRGWRNLPEVAQYMYADRHIEEEEHQRWFARIGADATVRYWIITCDHEDVGLVNVYNIDQANRRCYWAFYLASSSVRGKGVGSFVEYSVLEYVFGALELNKLCCEVLSSNEPVVNMHKSFGFQQEGLFREHIIKGGRAHDVVCLAILRLEWQAIKPAVEERLRGKGLL